MLKSMLISLLLLLSFIHCTHNSMKGHVQNQRINTPMAHPSKPIKIESQSTMTEEQWKKKLTPEEFYVLREKGTEPAFKGQYTDHHDMGIYFCKGCQSELFRSDAKFDSHCGWPSFYECIDKKKITETIDLSYNMKRIEVTCSNCGGHLGHVFDDGPMDKTGLRYCINSISIGFRAVETSDTL